MTAVTALAFGSNIQAADKITIMVGGMDKQIYLLLRQCTPLRRRTKRAQREVMWKPESLSIMRVLLRCAHGTLLGLYPTSVRSVAFTWRRAIFAMLRTLLVQPFEALNTCLSHMRYICKVCLMEHLCNTIQDYHPGLAYILNCRSGQLALFSQVRSAPFRRALMLIYSSPFGAR